MQPIPPQPYEAWAIIFLFFLLPLGLMMLVLMQRSSYEWISELTLFCKSIDDKSLIKKMVESMLAELMEHQRYFARLSKILNTIIFVWLGLTILVFLVVRPKLHPNIAFLPWMKIGIVYIAWILVLSAIVIWRKKVSTLRILNAFSRDFGSSQ